MKDSLIGTMRLSQTKVSSQAKSLDLMKIGVLCQTKMAFELEGLTEADLASHLRWSTQKLDNFFIGKYNPTYLEFVIIVQVFNLSLQEIGELLGLENDV